MSEPTPLAYARDKLDVRAQAKVRFAANGRAPAWLAMAATLVLGLGLGFVGTRSLAPDSAAPQLVASPTRIVYDTMRGEPTPPRVEHADSKSAYVLIEVAVPPGAENIVLNVESAKEQSLSASPDGFVSFLVPRNVFNSTRRANLAYVVGGQQRVSSVNFDANKGDQRENGELH